MGHGGPQATAALGLATALPQPADFRRPFDTPLPLQVKTSAGVGRIEVVNCADWLAHRAQAVGSDNDAAWRVVRYQVVPCEAMAVLAGARAAAQSALPADFGRELATAAYPGMLWPAPSPDEERRFAAPGMTLARSSGAARWSVDKDGALQLVNGRWRLRLQLLARGDFDGDGWEDAAFAWQAESQQGSYADAKLVLLTRRAGDAVFRSMAAEPLLAPAGLQNRK